MEVDGAGQGGAGAYVRLFDLRPDGSDYLLYFTRPSRELSSGPEVLPALRRAAGVFVGNGASRLYEQGLFGQTIMRGGDGVAERRYVETVLLTQRHVMNATRWALSHLPWDLLFTYTPFPDEAEHLWRGYLEATLPGHRADVARRLQPFLDAVYQTCDDVLGVVMRLRPATAVIAQVSDHGMEGINRVIAVNSVLQRAGLLTIDAGGVSIWPARAPCTHRSTTGTSSSTPAIARAVSSRLRSARASSPRSGASSLTSATRAGGW